MSATDLQGPWIIDYTVKGAKLRISLGTYNKVDPNIKLQYARREVNCLENVRSPEDFTDRAMAVFRKFGFVRVD